MRLKNFSLSYGTQLLKALSDESRVRILFLMLQNEEMCISDLELVLDFTQTKTSRHLTYLKNSGIVGSRKVDQWVYYFIKEEVADVVQLVFQYMNKDTTLLNDQENYRVLYSNRELARNKLDRKKWLP